MTVIDDTKKNSPDVNITIKCEGIRTTGVWCEREFVDNFPKTGGAGDGKAEGKTLTKAQRVAKARRRAQKEGWSTSKGVDACARKHGFVPTIPAPKDEG